MRKQDNLAALVRDFIDGRPDALEPSGVGDAAVLGRHVKIDAQQHALFFDVDIIEGAELFHVALSWSCPGQKRKPDRDVAPITAVSPSPARPMTRTRYAKASPNVPGQSSHAFAMPASPVMTT